MKFEIKHRFTENVLYACEAGDLSEAVLKAVSEGANLRGAYLEGANLEGANLEGAYLRGAYMRGAYMRGAYLRGANLEGANLRGANLRGANLEGAYLEGANLEGANLEGAYLRGAYLEGANLEGEELFIAPVQVANIGWFVTISEGFMRIGCQRHTHKEWKAFTSDEIERMSGGATEFWSAWKTPLLAMCKQHRKLSLAARKAAL